MDNTEKRGNAIFLLDWYDTMKILDKDTRLEVFDAVMLTYRGEPVPPLSQLASVVFSMMKPIISENVRKYQAKCDKNRENAKKSHQGKSKAADDTECESEDDTASDGYRTEANATDGYRTQPIEENRIEKNRIEENKIKPSIKENDGNKESIGAEAPRTLSIHRFVKPSPKEVDEYSQEQGYWIDGQHFCDYYESNGWKVGRNPMKNWRAAVRTWIKKERENPTNNNINNQNNHNNGNYQRTKGPNPAELFRAIEHGLTGGDVPF